MKKYFLFFTSIFFSKFAFSLCSPTSCEQDMKSWSECFIFQDLASLSTECDQSRPYATLTIEDVQLDLIPNRLFSNYSINELTIKNARIKNKNFIDVWFERQQS